MTDCQFVLDSLWDWLAEGDLHPEAHRINHHLEQCTNCAQEAGALRSLRSGLKDLRETAPRGFEDRLQVRLNEVRFAERQSTRSAPGKPAGLAARRINVWARRFTLVAAGAAAVLLVSLIRSGFTPLEQQGLAEAPVDPPARSESPAAGSNLAQDRVGLLEDREYSEQDSMASESRDSVSQPGEREALHRASSGTLESGQD